VWLQIAGHIGYMTATQPLFIAFATPFIITLIILIELFTRISRTLQQLDSLAASPVLSQYSELITGCGLATVRSAGVRRYWRDRFFTALDDWVQIFTLSRQVCNMCVLLFIYLFILFYLFLFFFLNIVDYL
jgi:hypothetical protein